MANVAWWFATDNVECVAAIGERFWSSGETITFVMPSVVGPILSLFGSRLRSIVAATVHNEHTETFLLSFDTALIS